MKAVVEILIAAVCAVVVVLILWKVANALRQRGVVVRPASTMDHLMTRIETDQAEGQGALKRPLPGCAESARPDD